VTVISALPDYLAARRATIDAALERVLPRPPLCPPVVAEAMRYSVFAGGKRFRPILTLAAAEAVVPPDRVARALEEALPAACAVELIHTYSLIHDDLPAMDDDVLRRGRPTAHVVYGEGMAILAGDALLAEAFGLLAREPAGDDPDLVRRKLRTIQRIAEAAGPGGMVGGQALDLQGGRVDAETLQTMHAGKTGALIRAAAVAGAIMAGAADPAIDAIDRYAADLGLAFQIVDDILDVEGSAADLGKTAGKDAAAGKATYPALYGVATSRTLAREAVARACAALEEAAIGGQLAALAHWVLTRSS
jgi:geranylgeranyl diphosphate synthase type II